MFRVEGTNITLSRGDTGSMRIHATVTRKDTGAPYTFGENDRAVFSVKNGSGTVVKEQAYKMTDNTFTVVFFNADTDRFAAGGYTWDVRYVINTYYDEKGNVVDGDQVLTPNTPMQMNLLNVVANI